MEGLLSARQRYRTILSALLPAGALGMTILLGSPAAQAAREMAADPQASLAPPASVSQRLGAIRDAVSDAIRAEGRVPLEGTESVAWANIGVNIPFLWPFWNNWGNGGWGNGGWRNGGWRNGGWHNGGWHNGGWHNGWRNY
jgi:rSAM-associated Gly-rich repeat protein